MKKPSFLLFLIIIIAILALIINIPQEFTLASRTPKLPFLNKEIVVNQKIHGLPLSTWLASRGIRRDFSFRKGLDLEGGTSITLRADMKGIPQASQQNALESAKEVIERRVNFFGVSEPLVQTSKVNNDYRIIAEIPGVTDVNQAVRLIGTTAKLTFWEQGASGSAEASPSASLPLGITQFLGPNAKQTNLTGGDLKQSDVVFNPNTGKPEVQLSFTGEGSKKFADITKRNVGNVVAIVLDSQIVEVPRVNEPITGGSARISGEFTTQQANALRAQLNAGALPVPLSVLEQRSIGATLGNESLHKSLLAGVIGFFVIVIFMCVLYGRLGFIASLALVLYTLIVLSLFRLIPVTLTLAGIAGFILSIGIAVDANILIFERMKEELRRGRTHQTAMEIGFTRAWPSIRDSNIASLITSVILYMFGTGIVRGFAFVLAIGVLVSMFSAITVTRTLLRYLYR